MSKFLDWELSTHNRQNSKIKLITLLFHSTNMALLNQNMNYAIATVSLFLGAGSGIQRCLR